MVGDGGGAEELFAGGTVRDALVADGDVGIGQVGHHVEAGEGVFGVEDGGGVLAAEVVLDVLAGEGGASADHGDVRCYGLEVLDYVLHLQGDFTSRPERPMASALWSLAASMMAAAGCLMRG